MKHILVLSPPPVESSGIQRHEAKGSSIGQGERVGGLWCTGVLVMDMCVKFTIYKGTRGGYAASKAALLRIRM